MKPPVYCTLRPYFDYNQLLWVHCLRGFSYHAENIFHLGSVTAIRYQLVLPIDNPEVFRIVLRTSRKSLLVLNFQEACFNLGTSPGG